MVPKAKIADSKVILFSLFRVRRRQILESLGSSEGVEKVASS